LPEFFNRKARGMEGTVFMASPRGKKPGSHNFKKSIYAQVGMALAFQMLKIP